MCADGSPAFGVRTIYVAPLGTVLESSGDDIAHSPEDIAAQSSWIRFLGRRKSSPTKEAIRRRRTWMQTTRRPHPVAFHYSPRVLPNTDSPHGAARRVVLHRDADGLNGARRDGDGDRPVLNGECVIIALVR